MKFAVSTFVIFLLVITSSTVSLGQRIFRQPAIANSDLKSDTGVQKSADLDNSSSLGSDNSAKHTGGTVQFASQQAFSDGTGVYIQWQMETETGNLGFQVFRVRQGQAAVVEDKFIASSNLTYQRDETLMGEKYNIFDPKGLPHDHYYVKSYARNGDRVATRTFGVSKIDDLASITGESSSSMVQRLSLATGRDSQASPAFNPELRSIVDQNLVAADPDTQKWVAAQPGVKFGVRKQGIYRVTKAQLQAAGFDVNSDPNYWQLYTDGVEQAIIVGPNGDYIDFYGKGIDTTESDTKMYFLVAGPQPGKRMATTSLRPAWGTVKATSYDETAVYKERFFYILEVINGDAENYFGRFVDTTLTTPTFDLGPVDTSAVSAHVTVKLMGFSSTAHAINVTLNGHALGQAIGPNGSSSPMLLDVTVPGSYLVSGNNAVGLASTVTNEFSYLDSIQVTYRRQYVANQNKLAFTLPNYRGAVVQGFASPNIRVFETTYDGNPAQLVGPSITPNGGTYDLNLPAYRNRSVFAVEDSALLSPDTISANAPSTWSTTNHNGQLIIISYKDFLPQAEAWANYRRAQGTSVEVVNVEDVYDEFNYGILSANSLKDFLNYARSNWQTPPSYVLLIGDGWYDPRNYEGKGNFDLVPAKLVDTGLNVKPMETASDDAIVDFDGDGLAEMAIGRIPARTSAMVTNAYNKTVKFETLSSTQNLSRGVIFHYDNPMVNWSFQDKSIELRDLLPAGTPNYLIARADQSPNQALVAQANNGEPNLPTGRYLFNFAGHGTAASMANSANFSNAYVSQLTNTDGPTVFTMLTCLNGYFHGVDITSLSEFLLNSTGGGAVAAWASSGETTPDIQQIMAKQFYSQIAAPVAPGATMRLGDLVVNAKSVIVAGRDVRLSWVLIGDPMLKMK